MKLRLISAVALTLLSSSAFAEVAGTGVARSTSTLTEMAEKYPKLDFRTLKAMAEDDACQLAHRALIGDLEQKCVRVLNEEGIRYVELDDRKIQDCTYTSNDRDYVTAVQIGSAECRSKR